MAKTNMNDLLRKRMNATQQASELVASDEAYQHIFQKAPPPAHSTICDIPMDKLIPFYTADIGFKPYAPSQLQAFSEQLSADGLFVRIIARKMPNADTYEILAGHNRVNAAKLAGWVNIPAEIVEVDDARAIVIATSTNLIQRQNLSIVERGKAYKALLDANNRNGQRNAKSTFGDNRQRSEDNQKYSARKLVSEFFDVSEYEIRKAVKIAGLVPELVSVMEDTPRRLNLACAALIADYNEDTQKAFVEMYSADGYCVCKSTMQYIVRACPPPSAQQQEIFDAWHAATAIAERQKKLPSKKISFDRKRFAPYLTQLKNEDQLESLFIEFLKERISLGM